MLAALERNWSWVVVAASFFNQFITMGFPFSLGIYNVEFLETFGDTKANTAWVSSMNLAFVLGAGPVVAYVMERTSLRLIACIGAFVSTAGVILSMFATKLFHLYISIGIIMGTGNCMVFVPSAVMVGLYFTKNRTFATALSSCGSSVGMVLMPIIYTKIIDEYTWRRSMFINAGLCMQTLVFSALLRPVNEGQNIEEEVASVSDMQTHGRFEIDHVEYLPKKDALDSMPIISVMTSEQTREGCNGDLASHIDRDLILDDVAIKDSQFDRQIDEHLKEEIMALVETRDTKTHKNILTGNKMSGMDRVLYRLRQNAMFDSRFLIYIINNIMWNLGASTVTVITADYMYVAGANKLQFSIIMLMVGVGSVIGAILFAFLGKWKPNHLVSMYCGLCLSCGLVAALYAITTDIVVIGILGSLFGMTTGGIVSWLLAVLADLIGISKLGEAFGYLMLANGIGTLAGPPLGGWLYDVTGNYSATFWIAGSLIFGSGLLMAALPLKQRCAPHSEKDCYPLERINELHSTEC